MKAEDTVMGSNDRHCCTTTRDMCERQAEISFKAGMKKVALWVTDNPDYFNSIDKWNAKLKEWGIE